MRRVDLSWLPVLGAQHKRVEGTRISIRTLAPVFTLALTACGPFEAVFHRAVDEARSQLLAAAGPQNCLESKTTFAFEGLEGDMHQKDLLAAKIDQLEASGLPIIMDVSEGFKASLANVDNLTPAQRSSVFDQMSAAIDDRVLLYNLTQLGTFEGLSGWQAIGRPHKRRLLMAAIQSAELNVDSCFTSMERDRLMDEMIKIDPSLSKRG